MFGDSVFDLFIHVGTKIFHYHDIRHFSYDGIIAGFYVITIYHNDHEPEELHFAIQDDTEFLFEVFVK